MPKLGMYLEDVRLVEWLREEGAEVNLGEPIFVLETDKVTTEVEADAAGILHRIVPADSMVPIGGVIGKIAADRGEYEHITRDGVPATEAEAPGFEAAQSELFLDYIRSAGEDEEPAEPVTDPQVEWTRPPGGGRPISPRARALIAEQGLAPEVVEGIPGSGPGGRLTDKDVKAFLEAGGAPNGHRPVRSEPLWSRSPSPSGSRYGARRVIARRMLESLQSTAQLTSVLEIDVDAVVGWRNRSEPRLGYTTIFTALVAVALEAASAAELAHRGRRGRDPRRRQCRLRRQHR